MPAHHRKNLWSAARCDRDIARRYGCSAECPNIDVRTFRDLFVLRARKDDGIVVVFRGEGGVMAHTKARTSEERQPTLSLWERGINLEVPGSELVAQAAARIAWHKDNATRIKEELSAIEAAGSTDHWQRRGRRTDLTRLMLAHEDHARFLTFVKEHLKPRQIYRLGFADMMALELTPKGSLV
jgi:hypothetical protein